MARQSPRPGHLLLSDNVAVTIDDIADEAGTTVKEAKAAVDIFLSQNMLTVANEIYNVIHFDRRQPTDKSVTERVRKYREKQKETSNNAPLQERYNERYSNVTATNRNGNETPLDTEADTDTDTEEEGEEGEEDNVVLPAASSAEMTEVFKVFQNEIGIVSQVVAEKVADDVNTYSAPWVIHAIKIAVLRGKRSLPYAESILSDWQSKGFDQTRKPWDEEKKGVGVQHHGANRENTYQGSVGGKSQNSGPAVPSRVRKAGDS